MERLLADAEKLSGVEYNIDNLGDVYDAIHVIQEDLGLTGVAAAEAETTLSGSFGAMKASWENLMAAMTTGEGLDSAMQNLGTSAGNLLKNVVRMAGNIAKSLPQLFTGLFTTIGPAILPVASEIINGLMTGITTQLPALLTGGMTILGTLLQGIVTALPGLLTTGMQFIPTLVNGFLPQIPGLLAQGVTILGSLISGILQAIPQLLGTAGQVIAQLVAGIGENLPTILEQGIALLGQLAAGAIQGIGQLVATIPQIFSNFKTAFNGIDWASLGRNIISGIVNGIGSAAGQVLSALSNLAKQALEEAKAALGINSPSRLFRDQVGSSIPEGVAVGITDNLDYLNRPMQILANASLADMKRAMAPGVSAPAASPVIDYAAMAEAISNRPVVIQGDTSRIFKVVREQNIIRTKATNWNALGAATT